MMPMGLVLLMAGGMVVGAFLKLFADHRTFRNELKEQREQLDTVLDVLSTVALDASDSVRMDRVRRTRQLPDSIPDRSPADGS